jgi:hypothetical protein
MSFFAQWIHLFNLAFPAGLTAVCLVMLTPILVQKPRFAYRFVLQGLIIFITGLCVTLGGLYVSGQDGKMLTYAVMVLAMGLVQSLWVLRLKRT